MVQLVLLLICLPSRKAPTEEMRIDDVAKVGFGPFPICHHVLHEIVQASNVDPSTMWMLVVVVVANVGEVAPVIKYAYLQGMCTGYWTWHGSWIRWQR